MKIKHLVFAIISFISIFSACKKEKPAKEVQQEEYSKVEVTFIQGTFNTTTGLFTATANVAQQKVTFDSDGKSNQTSALQLRNGSSYQLNVDFIDTKGENVNDEFKEHADEHQIFFVPSSTGATAISYTYGEKERVGLSGEMKALTAGNTFDLTINLRHGIDKSNGKTYVWNDTKYNQYGETDFNGVVKLQTIAQ